ncbi:SLBB domain-containing protein [Wenzhouxiangella sp. XN24]|uniref:SLBB domain-containing protein n=1 Tax=Wenzhouxiangella sp. XN24 TaxID=2713569 RepID=UPI0013ED22E0|nr:SLBB domain-containing protein [Wenzhouxiangella sp. XN24]NGX17011.1 sugar transporter [Wenzhouxiangella sp. XN24]
MNRLLTLSAVLAVLLLSLLSVGPALAQTPTPAQLEMFRQLPQAEQQRLMRQYGIQPSQLQPGRQPQALDDTRDERAFRDGRNGEAMGDGQNGENGQNGRGEGAERGPAQVIDPATGLPLFGYDLFSDVPSTFAPVTDVPVPVDYVLGPGDVVNVQLMGATPGSFTLAVNRDGAINFPELGPITVAGMTFDEARRILQERVSQQMIGATASVTMGELRSIRVFVLGDAQRPGSYTVSSLSTITNALFASGGVKPIGSLRNIELKRNGALVTRLDLYDLLLRGDTRGDVRLMPGDVIFIPPVGTQVAVDGEVRRPAVYEIKGATTTAELVELAGGLTAGAYPQGGRLARISEDQARILLDVDLKSAAGQGLRLRGGDLLEVPSVLERVDNTVQLLGHVYRPMRMQYRPGLRISDLVPSLSALKPLADANYVLIRRERAPDRRIMAVSVDLEAALRAKGSAADIELQPRDRVTVFSRVPLELEEQGQNGQNGSARSRNGVAQNGQARPGVLNGMALGAEGPEELQALLEADRRIVVDELLDELRLQADFDSAAEVVRVGGRVRAPGLYPLEPGMRVSDLLRAGGSLAESAYITEAEVTRYEVVNGEYREAELISIDLAAVRAGIPGADLLLGSYDFLHVKEVTNWTEQHSVELRGEVRFPGTYPIRVDETLLSVIQRAGGLTERAFINGAVFTRVKLREREAQQLRELAERMEADMSALALQQAQEGGAQTTEALATGRGLLSELNQATAVGRLAMDLRRVLAAEPGSRDDIILEDGDVLMVPGPMQSVTVLGEVQSPTSILFEERLSRDDYINLSGGTTRRADSARIYIVRANGHVTASGSRKWFQATNMQIEPGDTIVVPTDIERMRPLSLWSAVTTIIFNLAVAVAAVNSF